MDGENLPMSHEPAKNATTDGGDRDKQFASGSKQTSNIEEGWELSKHRHQQDHVDAERTGTSLSRNEDARGTVTGRTGFAHSQQAHNSPAVSETQDKLTGIHPQATQQNTHSEAVSRSSTPNQYSPHEHSRGNIVGLEGFVQPSSFLRRGRGYSRTMPQAKQQQQETAIDREQRLGLVCCLILSRVP